MYSLNAFLRLSDGDTQDFNVKLEDKEILDVHAVYTVFMQDFQAFMIYFIPANAMLLFMQRAKTHLCF